MTSAPISALRGLVGLLEAGREFWVNSLRQPDPGDLAKKLEETLSASFVDYARGDGATIGAGRDGEWSPILISDDDTWVDGYRGLFGLDTHDRFGGERSPAGPKYARSGEQRLSWHDPLGFGGLDKADPPFQWPQTLAAREQELRARGSGCRRQDQGADRPSAGPVAGGRRPRRRWRPGVDLPETCGRSRGRRARADGGCAGNAPHSTIRSAPFTARPRASMRAIWAIREHI